MGTGSSRGAPFRGKDGAVGTSSATRSSPPRTRDPATEIKLLFLGAGGSGKTNLLYSLHEGRSSANRFEFDFPSTMGYNHEVVSLGSVKASIWDCGGGNRISPMFRHFSPGCHGIVYVLGSFRPDLGLTFPNNANLNRAPYQAHHDSTYLNFVRTWAELRGVPILLLINAPPASTTTQPTDSQVCRTLLGCDAGGVHERPFRVFRLTADMEPALLQGPQALGWFETCDQSYARGDVWSVLPVSAVLPAALRGCGPRVLAQLHGLLGSPLVSGFCSSVDVAAVEQLGGQAYRAAAPQEGWFGDQFCGGGDQPGVEFEWGAQISPLWLARLNCTTPGGVGMPPLGVSSDGDSGAAPANGLYEPTRTHEPYSKEWLGGFVAGSGLDHFNLLHLIFDAIRRFGRPGALARIFAAVEQLDGGPRGLPPGHSVPGPAGDGTGAGAVSAGAGAGASACSLLSVTRVYFWIQLVDFNTRLVESRRGSGAVTFRALLEEHCFLQEPRLIYSYYSSERLHATEACKEMVLPDLKPLPSVLPSAAS